MDSSAKKRAGMISDSRGPSLSSTGLRYLLDRRGRARIVAESEQAEIQSFIDPAATHTESVVRTVVCPLETSRRKSARARDAIEGWQTIAAHMADVLASHQPSQWRSNATITYQALAREFPDKQGLMSSTAQQAAEKVAEAYDSWAANGRPTHNHPRGEFGDGSYLRFRADDLELVSHNDGCKSPSDYRDYGVKLKLAPYSPEWFGIRGGKFQTEYLDRVLDEETSTRHGSAELHIGEAGGLALHLTVKDEIEVYDVGDVSRTVGVDVGETAIYAVAAVDRETNEPLQVESESGREFRHHRDRLSSRIAKASQSGELSAVKLRHERERYTDQMLHVASAEIVDFAAEHLPCCIALEDLTGMRATVKEPIHDWPYADLQEKISYKATARGIPVETVDPAGTSTTCRKCGSNQAENRRGTDFRCLRCSYEPPHADEHAAINIASRRDGALD